MIRAAVLALALTGCGPAPDLDDLFDEAPHLCPRAQGCNGEPGGPVPIVEVVDGGPSLVPTRPMPEGNAHAPGGPS